MNTTRNFLCPETETNCTEPNCRRGHCILQLREAAWEQDEKQRGVRTSHGIKIEAFKTEEQKLRRRVQSVGMEFFASFYPMLSNPRVNDAEAVRRIRETRGYAEIASQW